MRTLLLLFALFAVGCASSPKRYGFTGGVVTTPATAQPSYAPAGAGLPGERVPGQQSAPRSTWPAGREEYAPEAVAKAKGLWAVDRPKNATDPTELLGLKLPPLHGVPEDAKMTEACAKKMKRWYDVTVPEDQLKAILNNGKDIEAQFRCLAARLFSRCLMDDYQRNLKKWNAGNGWHFSTAHLDAQRLIQKHCPEPARTHDVLRVERTIVDGMDDD